MKITLIAPLPPIKSISSYCYDLATALSNQIDLEVIGFHSVIPGLSYAGGQREEKVDSFNIKNVKILNIIKHNNPFTWLKAGLTASGDIIHLQHWGFYANYTYSFLLPLLKLRRKKIIICIHNITPHVPERIVVLIDRYVNKFLFMFADFFIVHNTRNKEKLLQLYNIESKKVAIIPHGVYPHQKKDVISKSKARELLNIPQDKKIILFFGYIWRYKGVDTLLNALKQIKKHIPEILLLVVGEPLDFRDNWERYEKLILEYHLQDYVIRKIQYIPSSEVHLYFSATDLVALPYREPFDTHGGIGSLALSFDKPMVVSDVGGLPEYVKDARVISQPEDYISLSKNIIHIFNDTALLQKLEKDSKERAKELSWDKIAEKTIDIYQVILNER